MSLVKIESYKNYEILYLNRGNANPINADLCGEITTELRRIENDGSKRGLIITGNTPGYFSVGLDLKELYYHDERTIGHFWYKWDEMLNSLIHFKKPLISAINGHSPAGGCVIAATCDYRIMADDDKYIIGLNETSVGIAVPENIFLLYQFWIGKNAAYHCLMDGSLHSPSNALKIGLINEVCNIKEVLCHAKRKMDIWLLKSDKILQNSKANMRAQLIKELKDIEEVSDKEKLKIWFDPKSRELMRSMVLQLSK
ncbi:MAG: enoyl-CoA hydratase/isomerase family protein [Saprospiraceae bacterium]